ncbi:FIST N-terminal domain-containing protein [Fluviibacterium sp. S390]|uniref:FIST N-terminal domain-containing protein n=1 Tax=Fluviibacterium sp. S390 TaxID=3415139 RepID=UPI003C7D3C6B
MAEQTTIRRAAVPAQRPDCMDILAAQLGSDLAQLFLFVDADADFDKVVAAAGARFEGVEVVACTTAGEITEDGYSEGNIVAVGFPRKHFQTSTLLVPDLKDFDATDLTDEVVRQRLALEGRARGLPNAFAFLVIDGMSLREDQLMSAISSGLAAMPVFGGSAGDGVRFEQPKVALNGVVYRNAAVITQVRTDCEVKVFSLDHFQPGDARMVVTGAEPARRIVREINGRPAAREYARILGKNPDYLSPFTFAAHPLVVRVGGQHHVRAIQRVTEDGALVFYSAIGEGIVLTLAKAENMADHLDAELDRLTAGGSLDTVLACDCVLRRIEATQHQQVGRLSQILRKHNVVGFNTYGEQVGAKHVNQTMTGVAFFHPQGSAE